MTLEPLLYIGQMTLGIHHRNSGAPPLRFSIASCQKHRQGPQHVRAYISPYSGRDCVKSLRSSYTGLYPQSLQHVGLGVGGGLKVPQNKDTVTGGGRRQYPPDGDGTNQKGSMDQIKRGKK